MKRLLLIFLVMAFLTACGQSNSSSPTESLNALFDHAKNGEYSEMEKYISTNILNAMESNGYGMNAYADDITQDGDIEAIEVVSEDIKGEGATIQYIAKYKDDTEKEESVSLIKEDDTWKVSPK